MPEPIYVSAVQYASVVGSPVDTQDTALHLMDLAALTSDLIVLPELSFSVHWLGPDLKEFAVPVMSPITSIVSQVAVTRSAFICYGIVERFGAHFYNTAVLVGADGRVVGSHRKICLTEADRTAGFSPGQGVQTVDTHLGRIGMLIGNDILDSENTRMFLDQGARIILMPSSAWAASVDTVGSIADSWYDSLAATAKDTRCHVIWANKIGMEGRTPSIGNSMVLGPLGNILARGSFDQEENVRATIQFERGGLQPEAA